MTWPEIFAVGCTIIYILDRIWKVAVIRDFFRQPPPPEPAVWPSVSLIQPVTAGPNNLQAVLALRVQIDYPGPIEQIIVLDKGDAPSQLLCRELMRSYPLWKPRLVFTDTDNGIALKTVKQLAGLGPATGEVFCFVDDDILLRRDTLKTLVRYLCQDGIGATFGLACYTNWRSTWSALMSAFVNANSLLNYIPTTYLTETFTITGHIYALKQSDFQAIGGLTGMEMRLDDDHELARRVIKGGLQNLQTPAIYDVDNELPVLQAFINQMKRWFIFPRELMLPGMRTGAQIATFINSLPNLLPGLVLLTVFFGGRSSWLALAICLLGFYLVYLWIVRRYLKSSTPIRGWSLLPVVALILPFQILAALFSNNAITWRGQRLRVKRGGEYDLVKRA